MIQSLTQLHTCTVSSTHIKHLVSCPSTTHNPLCSLRGPVCSSSCLEPDIFLSFIVVNYSCHICFIQFALKTNPTCVKMFKTIQNTDLLGFGRESKQRSPLPWLQIQSPGITISQQRTETKSYFDVWWSGSQWSNFKIWAFIHSFIHSYIHSFIHSYIHSFIHSYIHSFIHAYIHSFIHTFIRSFIRSFIHTFIRSFIHPFIHSFIHPFIHSFIHDCIHTVGIGSSLWRFHVRVQCKWSCSLLYSVCQYV